MLKKFFQKSTEPQKHYPTKRDGSAEVIRMPKMSDSMKSGKITKWYFQVGDYIKPRDILAEVETDNATMELECYEHGVILYLSVDEGGSVPVNGIIAIIGNEDEDITHLISDDTELEVVDLEKVDGFVGEVKLFAGDSIPDNWLVCDGAKYSKNDKEELFSIIEYNYGGSDGQFQVPEIEAINGVHYIICWNKN